LSDPPALQTTDTSAPSSPFRRYVEYVQPTIWELAERRWYGAMFIEEHMLRYAPDLPAEALGAAANCFHDEHDMMWEIAALSGVQGGDPTKNLAEAETRCKIAEVIQRAKAKDIEAVDHLERALTAPSW